MRLQHIRNAKGSKTLSCLELALISVAPIQPSIYFNTSVNEDTSFNVHDLMNFKTELPLSIDNAFPSNCDLQATFRDELLTKPDSSLSGLNTTANKKFLEFVIDKIERSPEGDESNISKLKGVKDALHILLDSVSGHLKKPKAELTLSEIYDELSKGAGVKEDYKNFAILFLLLNDPIKTELRFFNNPRLRTVIDNFKDVDTNDREIIKKLTNGLIDDSEDFKPLGPKKTLTRSELEKIDFESQCSLSKAETEAIHKYFDEKYEDFVNSFVDSDGNIIRDLKDFDISEITSMTKPLCGTLATAIMYPSEFHRDYLNLEPFVFKKSVPYTGPPPTNENGEVHPLESTVEREIRGDLNPLQIAGEKKVKYKSYSDYFVPSKDEESQFYAMSKALKKEIKKALYEPGDYPFPIPHTFNFYNEPVPTAEEVKYNIRLIELTHPYDWHILRKQPYELTFTEIDRVIHLAEVSCKRDNYQSILEVRNDLKGAFSRAFTTPIKAISIPERRIQAQLFRKFVATSDNTMVCFYNFVRTALAKKYKKVAIKSMVEQVEHEHVRVIEGVLEHNKKQRDVLVAQRVAEFDTRLKSQTDNVRWYKVGWYLIQGMISSAKKRDDY